MTRMRAMRHRRLRGSASSLKWPSRTIKILSLAQKLTIFLKNMDAILQERDWRRDHRCHQPMVIKVESTTHKFRTVRLLHRRKELANSLPTMLIRLHRSPVQSSIISSQTWTLEKRGSSTFSLRDRSLRVSRHMHRLLTKIS